MTISITAALALEIAKLLHRGPTSEPDTDRRLAIIVALEAAAATSTPVAIDQEPGGVILTADTDGARDVARRRQQWLAKGRP